MVMNQIRKTHPTTSRQNRLIALVAPIALAAGLLGSQKAQAAELVQNGSFALGMAGWKTAPKLGDWNPLSAGAVALYPSTYGYSGPILYQNLNVPNVGGQTLALSARLQAVYPSTLGTLRFW
jgi:hypothetical protein